MDQSLSRARRLDLAVHQVADLVQRHLLPAQHGRLLLFGHPRQHGHAYRTTLAAIGNRHGRVVQQDRFWNVDPRRRRHNRRSQGHFVRRARDRKDHGRQRRLQALSSGGIDDSAVAMLQLANVALGYQSDAAGEGVLGNVDLHNTEP